MKNLAKTIGIGLAILALPFAAIAAGDAKTKNVTLEVTGMTCSDCEPKVRDALTALDGVEVKKVDHKTGIVQCTIDTEKVTIEAMEKAVEAAGFKAKKQSEKADS